MVENHRAEQLASLLRADLAKVHTSFSVVETNRADLLASLLRADLAKAVELQPQLLLPAISRTDHASNFLVSGAAKASTAGAGGGESSHLSWSSRLKVWQSRMQTVVESLRKGFFSVLLWAVLTMLLGTFYHHEKPHPPKLDPEGVNVSLHDRERLDRHRWRFGLFEWTEVRSMCCFSFFCAPIRWADTMRMAGFMNYFSALALAVGLTVLGYMTLGLGFVVLIGFCVHFRERMREKFDIRSRASDWLAFGFCPWCSIAQEARQIEEAYLARHHSVRQEYTARQPALMWLPARKV